MEPESKCPWCGNGFRNAKELDTMQENTTQTNLAQEIHAGITLICDYGNTVT